jgi:hypothetical protein
LGDKISGSLRRDVSDQLERLYAQARERTALDLTEFGETEAAARLPTSCPYTLDEVFEPGWYPESRSDVRE